MNKEEITFQIMTPDELNEWFLNSNYDSGRAQ
jgi:hypothetical protein